MADRIQLRRDIAANWTAVDPILSSGEIGLEIDTEQFKLGDGVHVWSARPYGGLAGPSGRPVYLAGADLSGHMLVRLDAYGLVIPADSNTAGAHGVLGITPGAVVTGGIVTVQNEGSIEHLGWTWTPGQQIFLGTAGALVQTLDPAALFCKVIGIAVSTTRVNLNLQPTIFI